MSEMGAALLLLFCFGLLTLAEILVGRQSDGPYRAADNTGRAVTNFGLGIAVMAMSSLPLISRLGASAIGADVNLGLARGWQLNWPTIFVITLLLESLTAYWLHRLCHGIPLLWRVHRVHHADAHVDISTGLRNHPVELLLTLPVGAAVIFLIGAPASVVIAVETLLFAAALWQHADLELPARIERRLGRWIVTPAFHRAHHLPDRRRHDGNYGDILILWDRLFGTLQAPAARADRVGLDRQRARPDHLADQLLAPFARSHEVPAPDARP